MRPVRADVPVDDLESNRRKHARVQHGFAVLRQKLADARPVKAVTGMPAFGGPQGGTRETCNWIAAAGAVDGRTATVVDRVPIYASPIDAGFAYYSL